ncbi:MAG: NUDIX domain-containing protein [Acidobacteria bacterium]|nr:NUDIX domain-containing protein [Acidobacteriota bacterium]
MSTADGQIVLYRRHAEQSYPNCLDLFGGHYEPADAPESQKTAWREMGEEIRFVAGSLAGNARCRRLRPCCATRRRCSSSAIRRSSALTARYSSPTRCAMWVAPQPM